MNKKLNTALFMIGATIFNLVLLFAIGIPILLALIALLRDRLGPGTFFLLATMVFLAALVGSFLIYNRIVKFIMRKIDMEKYFLPLFKRRPPRKDQ